MKAKQLFLYITSFFVRQRQSGTTTLLKRLAETEDVWVLVPDEKMKADFGPSAISFADLPRTQGIEPRPILVDNYTMLRLSEIAEGELADLTMSVIKRDRLINVLHNAIDEFKRKENLPPYVR